MATAVIFKISPTFNKRARTYGMEVTDENSKIMVNSTTDTSADITMNGEKLEEVTSFKYLGVILSKDDLTPPPAPTAKPVKGLMMMMMTKWVRQYTFDNRVDRSRLLVVAGPLGRLL
ncbi:hypothetical protein DPMN_008954 [Dreissena polymorpha]|uniref:Uncharacterized protein n=1 Tax=Dreissena polymorpha TaxID=45954 RepID=A0A9D4RZP9_DREPO|nr:hypothetical protein DPMN_008954 [Dreissena polymorpha]